MKTITGKTSTGKTSTGIIILGLCASLVLGGCTQREQGTAYGATVGALVGSIIGKGQGRLIAVGLGTGIGAMLGGHLGDRLDAQQNMHVDNTMHKSLEHNDDGQVSEWQDSNVDVSAKTLPLRTYQTVEGHYCREFQQEIAIGGEVERAYGTACRQSDGSWKIVA